MMASSEFDEIVAMFQGRVWPDSSAAIMAQGADGVVLGGFSVTFNVRCPYIDDGGTPRRGSLGMVVERNGARIGIEIDRDLPRRRSIAKLLQFAGERLLVLRCGRDAVCDPIQGITSVISIDVLDGPPPKPRPTKAAKDFYAQPKSRHRYR